ncbi:MAG: 30S ribosome-binding factor RbfA [Eubacteriales bacterium]|nr:30S ribosome-binding factor RbfA [Eubacteriales bacterium]
MANYRQGRLAEEIRKLISEMMLKDLKDPRLDSMISITDVEVTKDGSYATVYLDVLDTSKDPDVKKKKEEDAVEGLESASGRIRKEIGKKMHIRRTPELIFKIDRSMEYGEHIDAVIRGLGL